MMENAFVIPLLMGISFVLILFFGKRIKGGQGAHLIGIPFIAVVWVLSIVVGIGWIDRVNDAEDAAEEKAELEEEHGGEEGELEEGAPVVVGGGDGSVVLTSATVSASAPVLTAEEGEEKLKVEPVVETVSWWSNGGFDFTVGTHVDGLSAILLFVVASISLLVHLFSTEYVKGDRRYTHYYAFLSLFTASMLFFVLTENIIQLIVGWELVGLCSFALIGHWWEEGKNSNAALKAFLTNRVGDIGLLVGIITLYWAVREAGENTFSIQRINELAMAGELRHFLLLVAACCLMAAVASKSGQFPLHTWLPDAMAGPTPVSALIHAATMVVAGVYMIARLYPVFFEGFSIADGGANLMAIVGIVTVLGGGLLAFVQWDIKKVLAYSTVSQLGYMVLGLGTGAWAPAIFHLFTHAFFKAGLFLGAGSVSHAAHHTFDMRKMGGLRKYMPVTFWTFILCSLALAAVPPFAGFWSKDEILLTADKSGFGVFAWLGVAGGFLTAAYMTRCVYYVFFGEYRGEGTPHESPRIMTVPLMILAFMAVVAGFVQATWSPIGTEYLIEYVEPKSAFPALVHPAFSVSKALIATAVALAAIGIAAAWYWAGIGARAKVTDNIPPLRWGKTVLEQKYYLDHLYEQGMVAGTKGPLARATYWFNQNVIDRIVDLAGISARKTGEVVYDYVDQAVIDGAVNGAGWTAEGSGEALRTVQSGKVQQYGSLLFGAAAVLAILFVILV
ncbi:MAG: NADH-quinone oxidoreductase subunit L [Actinomycetota bacterium]